MRPGLEERPALWPYGVAMRAEAAPPPVPHCDLLVVGGGINGAGIARDAAGQGLNVVLVEQGDLAGATSSASSKLIHGGLRYLEFGEFRLVREALQEREVLLDLAPHLVWPLRFVLPRDPAMRPAWMLRLGLFLYDRLGGRRRLAGSRGLDLATAPEGAVLTPGFRRGFEYWDCWADDARLVVANALDAAAKGAAIRPRTRFLGARREDGAWTARLAGPAGAETLRARALVNAAGPWAADALDTIAGAARRHRLKLVQGSHLVVDRLHAGDHAYIVQNPDRRVLFLLPFLDRFTLIGTTDEPFAGDPGAAHATATERDYLLAAANRVLRAPVAAGAVRWSYAGVRPLFDDGSVRASAVTRDYAFDLDGDDSGAPLLTVYGGKLTTYRRLAEHAMAKLLPALGRAPRAWTATAPLPGGDMPGGNFTGFAAAFAARHAYLPPALQARYARLYGTRAEAMLDGARGLADLGRPLGGDLYEREVSFLRATEWAATADDILWRRTKLGLTLPAEAIAALTTLLGKGEEPAGRGAAI
jgi:glycerol-3-phosphate dehydrogenase